MKILMAGVLAVLMLAGCGSHNTSSIAQAPVGGKVNPTRFLVIPADADVEAAKNSLFSAVEQDGVTFDSLFGTAASPAGDDLAVCGHASRDAQDRALYFAYYNGELLLWDETAPHGSSTENQFLAMICSYR